jgi:hypothetical protein
VAFAMFRRMSLLSRQGTPGGWWVGMIDDMAKPHHLNGENIILDEKNK